MNPLNKTSTMLELELFFRFIRKNGALLSMIHSDSSYVGDNLIGYNVDGETRGDPHIVSIILRLFGMEHCGCEKIGVRERECLTQSLVDRSVICFNLSCYFFAAIYHSEQEIYFIDYNEALLIKRVTYEQLIKLVDAIRIGNSEYYQDILGIPLRIKIEGEEVSVTVKQYSEAPTFEKLEEFMKGENRAGVLKDSGVTYEFSKYGRLSKEEYQSKVIRIYDRVVKKMFKRILDN